MHNVYTTTNEAYYDFPHRRSNQATAKGSCQKRAQACPANQNVYQRWIGKGKAMKIAIYARVSTDKQDTENQLLQLREHADKQGWQVHREYVDYESGSKSDRVEFREMFTDAS